MRTLIAGFGNELRGDDGFGVHVIKRLAGVDLGSDVHLLEVGTGGIRLAQELLAGYDRLVIVDAMERAEPPGTLNVREVESVQPTTAIDLHMAIPSRALMLAQALGALPQQVFIVGCQPAEVDELITELSPPVANAVDEAVRAVRELVEPGGRKTCAARIS